MIFFFWGSGWVCVWLESTVEPAEAEQLEWLYYWWWSSWSCRRWHKKSMTCWEIRLSAWFLTGGTYSLIESSCFPRLLTTQVILRRKGSDTHTDMSEIFHKFHQYAHKSDVWGVLFRLARWDIVNRCCWSWERGTCWSFLSVLFLNLLPAGAAAVAMMHLWYFITDEALIVRCAITDAMATL